MPKRGLFSCATAKAFLCKIALVSVLLHHVLSFELTDLNHHPALNFAPPKGSVMAVVEESAPPYAGMIPLNRLGRQFLLMPQTLIPYPRAGRMLDDTGETLVAADFLLNDPFNDGLGSISTKRNVGPLSRNKRSAEDPEARGKTLSGMFEQEDFSELEPDLFPRPARKPRSKSKNAFVPRFGKRFSGLVLGNIAKRARALLPRVGRGVSLSRLDRNDLRFKVKSRGAFIPRTGRSDFPPDIARRAAFDPRIGRSGNNQMEVDDK